MLTSDGIAPWRRRWDVAEAPGAHRTAAWAERDIDDPTATFGELLYCLRVGIGLSTLALNHAAGLRVCDVHRLESGDRATPTREVVLALADALQATPVERDRVLWTAAHRPPVLPPLAFDDAAFSNMAEDAASDQCASPLCTDVHAAVAAMARRWRPRTNDRLRLGVRFRGVRRSAPCQIPEGTS